jgi:hypothetical protein
MSRVRFQIASFKALSSLSGTQTHQTCLFVYIEKKRGDQNRYVCCLLALFRKSLRMAYEVLRCSKNQAARFMKCRAVVKTTDIDFMRRVVFELCTSKQHRRHHDECRATSVNLEIRRPRLHGVVRVCRRGKRFKHTNARYYVCCVCWKQDATTLTLSSEKEGGV